jgi:dTMP kinase
MLITFEGIEGSGTTTQIDLLGRYLEKQGYEVVVTREPGGTPFGEAVRRVTLDKDLKIHSLPEVLVFMAVRAQHVEEVIMPALKNRKVILCDRFTDATRAYQGYGRGVDLGIIESLNRLVTKGVTPTLTFLFDCPAGKGLKRKESSTVSRDRIERETLDFHRRIRKAYLGFAKEEPKRFVVIDAAKGIEEIHLTVRERTETLLEAYGL